MPRKERVTKIIDGDTFETASRKNPVRLAGVEAPEKRQPGYGAAKKRLESLILDEEVLIDTKARDVYGRSVANVKVGRKSVNNAMRGSGKRRR
ncbi:MAG: thermonuclease family protein [Planctomycetota bacterium]|jgi:endonuclease YncB( thermonuclease family)